MACLLSLSYPHLVFRKVKDGEEGDPGRATDHDGQAQDRQGELLNQQPCQPYYSFKFFLLSDHFEDICVLGSIQYCRINLNILIA